MSDAVLHIAVGVLFDADGQVLISQRLAGKPGAGQWEFPGGKVEPGETVEAALARELDEELGIQVRCAAPLIRLRHAYPDRTVLLDTWTVDAFDGEPAGREGQAIRWIGPDRLDSAGLLEADAPIVAAVRLPAQMIVTPAGLCADAVAKGLSGLAVSATGQPHAVVRLRCPTAGDAEYNEILQRALKVPNHPPLLLDRQHAALGQDPALGLHLAERQAAALSARPVAEEVWFGVSAHNAAGLEQARCLNADFAVLGAVHATPSHPGAAGLGWQAWHALADQAGLPVYAIGGLTPADAPQARRHGAQGVAGIRAFWPC